METKPFVSCAFKGAIFAGLIWLSLAVPKCLAVELQPSERQIFELLKNAPGQMRPRQEIKVDPILTGVARARAEDLANRRYFDHVNPDGFGPNYLVERAGYRLPDWWGNGRATNYVESIAAGYSSPTEAWAGWMAHEHRIHLLGLDPFFRDQVRVGVGHYYNEDSTDGDYWVVITAPPSGPVVHITSPHKLHRTESREIHLAGHASSAPAQVQYSVISAGGTTEYEPANGTSDWIARITEIQPGRNHIKVRSLRADGSVLAEDGVVVKLIAHSMLTVAVEGQGRVTKGFLGASKRRLGKRYALEATPAPGWVFAGWTGSAESNAGRLTFRMSEGMELTAIFVPEGKAVGAL